MARAKQLKPKVWETYEIEVPLKGTTATYENNTLTVKGEKGEVSKNVARPRGNFHVS